MGIVNNLKLKVFLIVLFNVFLFTTISNANTTYQSSALQEVTTVSENVERIDYIDKNGKITYATDKHYATLVKTKRSHQVLEEFFDAVGKPAKQPKGYYALLREYSDDGREIKVTFLDIDGKSLIISKGYATVKRFYNDRGLVEKELFYDTDEYPIKSRYDGYGIYRYYDDNSRNTLIVYVDESGNPMIAGNGYAEIRRSFYEEGNYVGKVKDEYYFDEYDQPVTLSLGQSGLHKEYDELGRTCVLTYLDAIGNPVKTTKGYTTIKRTFYDDGSMKTEMYYDREGKPVRLSDGQYGVLKHDGKTIFLNSKGEKIFQLKNFLDNNQWIVILMALAIVLISSVCGFRFNVGMLVLYLAFIVYITLIQRNVVQTGIELRFLWSYKQLFSSDAMRWEIINNILLFIPLGAILYKFCPRSPILLLPISISFAIELIQYQTGTGLCEIDDVVSNGLGGMIGYSLAIGFAQALPCIRICQVNYSRKS